MDEQTSSRLDKLFNIEPDFRSQVQIKEMTDLLLKTQLFNSISKHIDMPAAVEACARKMRMRYVEAGQTVHKAAHEANEFFFIVRGVVSINAPYVVLFANTGKKRPSVLLPGMPLTLATKALESLGKIKNYNDETIVEVTTLGPGFSCGDIAILRNIPYILTVKAVDDVSMAYLDKSEFNKCLRRVKERRSSEKITFLSSLVHFKHLTSKGLYRIAACFHYKSYHKNELVYSEGDKADSVFIILSGEFEFSKTIICKSRGSLSSTLQRSISRRKALKVLTKSPKEFFGQEDLFENRKRFATCNCGSSKGEAYWIDLTDFETLIMPSPAGEILKNQHILLETFQQELLEKSTLLEESLRGFKTEDTCGTLSSRRTIANSASPESRDLSPKPTENFLHRKFAKGRSLSKGSTFLLGIISGQRSRVNSSSPLKSSVTVPNIREYLSAVPSASRLRQEIPSKLQNSISQVQQQLIKPPLRPLKNSPVWARLKDRTLMKLKLASNCREERIKELLKRKWE